MLRALDSGRTMDPTGHPALSGQLTLLPDGVRHPTVLADLFQAIGAHKGPKSGSLANTHENSRALSMEFLREVTRQPGFRNP